MAGLITKRLDRKIAVITGGNSGIGLATAQRFVQEGAFVFITGRRQNELDKAVKQIGKNVIGVQGDVTNLEDLDRLYETVKQQKGRIDVLFANAGFARSISCSRSRDAMGGRASDGGYRPGFRQPAGRAQEAQAPARAWPPQGPLPH